MVTYLQKEQEKGNPKRNQSKKRTQKKAPKGNIKNAKSLIIYSDYFKYIIYMCVGL